MISQEFVRKIGREQGLGSESVARTLSLLEEGNTVPFVARYRKEATGGLDEVQIREVQERFQALDELEKRRQTVLAQIEEQGKLSNELRRAILACETKTALEDLYLPYKPKRRTRAELARQRGLEPLAEFLWSLPPTGNPEAEARAFVSADRDVPDTDAAWAGARDIFAEEISELAELRSELRAAYGVGSVVSKVVAKRASEAKKFEQYFDYRERVDRIPSHRYLALCRGENEGLLRVRLELDLDLVHGKIRRHIEWHHRSPFSSHAEAAYQDAYKRLLHPSLEADVRSELKAEADLSAVTVFAQNLQNLILAAPLGTKTVIGIDPGFRTGCKCALVDDTGKLLEHTTIYPTQGKSAQERAAQDLVALVRKGRPHAVAIGNGTAGRETESFARKVLRDAGLPKVVVVLVNEAGASVYSASDGAREEFPDLDLTIRGAISIARRLQDPLAELVKIDPKSIGVGQYQHDVQQTLLKRKLDEVVESCVNRVGVELNTASAPLLSYVAGIGPGLAKKIVAHREEHGAFAGRDALRKVSGLGEKTFVQAAGFLRVRGGKHPLDASAVHPERYSLVERMAQDLGSDLRQLVGDGGLVESIDLERYAGDEVGRMTLDDIVAELQKPGRDPRATFEAPSFRDDIHEISDLSVDMVLEGVVTNVTDFGAFVDLGVHQDGLIHISELADRFVKDPHEVVQVGQRIRVKVLSIDIDRKRIGLSARQA